MQNTCTLLHELGKDLARIIKKYIFIHRFNYAILLLRFNGIQF